MDPIHWIIFIASAEIHRQTGLSAAAPPDQKYQTRQGTGEHNSRKTGHSLRRRRFFGLRSLRCCRLHPYRGHCTDAKGKCQKDRQHWRQNFCRFQNKFLLCADNFQKIVTQV